MLRNSTGLYKRAASSVSGFVQPLSSKFHSLASVSQSPVFRNGLSRVSKTFTSLQTQPSRNSAIDIATLFPGMFDEHDGAVSAAEAEERASLLIEPERDVEVMSAEELDYAHTSLINAVIEAAQTEDFTEIDRFIKIGAKPHTIAFDYEVGYYVSAIHAAVNVDSVVVLNHLLASSKLSDFPQDANPLYLARSADVTEALLNAGADINSQDYLFRTPLICATLDGREQCVHSLLMAKADVNMTDFHHRTALIHAAITENHGLLETILRTFPDVMVQDIESNTALHYAAQSGKIGLLRPLIPIVKDKEIDVRNNLQRSPLMLASISGDFECVEALCQFGADVNAQDIEQKTSLMFAAEAENMVIVNLLILHHADLSMRDKHHCSVLFLAAENNKLEVARVLLENEAHPLQRGRYLRSPMHEACRNKNLDMVKLLHEYNAKIDTIDQFFRTPLMLCAHASEYDTADPEVVAYLLEHKANVHRVDHDGAPIICRFASHPRALPLLLEHDPDLNAGDAINRTCLARVARNGDVSTARLIIERRAEVDVIDDTGATPIHWAVTNSLEMTQFLVEAKATVHGEANGLTPLHNACKSGYDVCKFLVDSGVDVTVRDPRGRTYLAHAAYCGNLKLVEMFFELGLSVDEPDMLGLTPLMLAAGTGYVEMVELLLKYGARLDALDTNGADALFWAIRRSHYEMTDFLLKAGLSPDVPNLDSVSAREWAESCEMEDIVELIEQYDTQKQ